MSSLILKKLYSRLSQKSGFGLAESIASILLLSVLVSWSVTFIASRQKIIYESNLIDAINDEIKRDIESIKMELWTFGFKEKTASTRAYYSTNRSKGDLWYCGNIRRTILELPSWGGTNTVQSWMPGSKSGVKGNVRNKIFTGRPVTITRQLLARNPVSRLQGSPSSDISVARIDNDSLNFFTFKCFRIPIQCCWS